MNELSSHSLNLIKQKDMKDFTPAPLKSTRSLSAIDTDRVMLVVVNRVQLQKQQFQHQFWSKHKTRAELEASLQNSELKCVMSNSGLTGSIPNS